MRANGILCNIYRHADKPRAEHLVIQYRILMMVEPNEGLLRDILGKRGILDYRPRGPKDSSMMKRERLFKPDTLLSCRRLCVGHYVHKNVGTLSHLQHPEMLIDGNTPLTGEI